MRSLCSLVVVLTVATLLLACGGDERQAVVDWVPFVRFEGVTYLQLPQKLPFDAALLGPEYDRVRKKLSDNVHDPFYRSGDGDAAFLPPGTPLYEVAGFAPRFMLATEGGGLIDLYVAYNVEGAAVARDVLDLEGKVARIDILSEVDGRTVFGSIDDAAAIEAFVASLMAAPVLPDARPAGNERYFLDFVLDHGIVVQRPYWADSGELLAGGLIRLPEDARQLVRAALP